MALKYLRQEYTYDTFFALRQAQKNSKQIKNILGCFLIEAFWACGYMLWGVIHELFVVRDNGLLGHDQYTAQEHEPNSEQLDGFMQ